MRYKISLIRKLLFLIFLFASALTATAQGNAAKHTLSKTAFVIDFDKKTIFVDSLDIPKTNNVESLMRLLPELLTRPGSDITTYYDIKINGVSLGDNYEPALEQLLIADVEKIELSESPISTYSNNGQGGSLDIILRQNSSSRDGVDKKLWGTASIGMGVPLDVMPYFSLNYKTDKLELQGFTLGELENRSTKSTTVVTPNVTLADNKERERNQFLGAYMKYNPTKRDALSFKFMESYDYWHSDISASLYQNDAALFTSEGDTTRTFQASILGNYQHQFSPEWKIEVEAQYAYKKMYEDSRDEAAYMQQEERNNTLSGTVNTSYRVFSGPGQSYGTVKLGADYNITDNNSYYYQTYYKSKLQHGDLDTQGNSDYVMPYLNWECKYKNFKLKIQGEYQIFNFRIKEGDDETSNYHHNDFTGMFVAEQQIGAPHHLRFMFTRKIQRPSLQQVYPFERILPAEHVIQTGNSKLLPMMSNAVSLDYISSYTFGRHHLTFDISGKYNHITDIVNDSLRDADMGTTGLDNYSRRSFYNAGHSDVWSADLMVFYRYHAFSCSLTANVYNKKTTVRGNTKSGTYYNISAMPAFRLPSGWSSSLYLAYHSKVKQTGSEMGECAYTQLNVSKIVGHCNLYLFQKSSFTGDVTDITFGENTRTEQTYSLVTSSVGIGVQYLF